ncbi:MAG: OmpH family outer membrane protein [Deltaproteobacteria bacterium]|nr:OmpH family outer membrane protein [Deltaproteobacteria bacterium]
MKKFFLVLLGATFLFSMQYTGAFAGDVKIGVLDMKRLQQHSTNFQRIKGELKKKYNAFQKKLDAERQQIDKLEKDLQKQAMMLSLDAKENKEMELGKLTRHYKYMVGEVTQEMKDAEFEATRKVGREIEKVVEKIAKKEGYTLILEQGTMGLVYYDDAIDITAQVIKGYDKMKQ